MKTITNWTLAMAVAAATAFAGQPVDSNHGQSSGKRQYDPVAVSAPQTKGQDQPGMAVKGSGVPTNGSITVPDGAAKGQATEGVAGSNSGKGAGPAIDDSKNISDGAAKGQANE